MAGVIAGRPAVRHEDDSVLVVSKPAGLVTHPAGSHHGTTLVDELERYWPDLTGADLPRAGLLHRLDKDTSGLLMIAKTPAAHAALSAQFADRTMGKRYVALVEGNPAQPAGVIDAPLTRHHADRTKMAIRPDGKAAQTRYETRRSWPGKTLLDLWIRTGRTHQIRVHLAALGHPIVGDATYGAPAAGLSRQFLHAAELSFEHPRTGQTVTVTDPLPPELESYLEGLDA